MAVRPETQVCGEGARTLVSFQAGAKCEACGHRKKETDEEIVWRYEEVFLRESSVYRDQPGLN